MFSVKLKKFNCVIVFAVVFNLVTAAVSAFISALTGYLLYRENCRRDKNPNETVSIDY